MSRNIDFIESTVKIFAQAKINLGLEIYGKRDDGYHEIRTLFQAISLADLLEISLISDNAGTDNGAGTPEAAGVELIIEGESVPHGKENIAWRAAELFLSAVKANGIAKDIARPKVRIRLKKNIPVGAGLGGGSSDAASILMGLNQLFHYPLSREDLLVMGEKLGADVPFFLFGKSAALGEGIGTQLTPVPALPESWLLLINPGFSISTKWAYDQINTDLLLTKRSNHINMLRLFLVNSDLRRLSAYLHNDFEEVVIQRYPIIGEIKSRLLFAGAEGAVMSGSGATVFGIFSNRLIAEQAFEDMIKKDKGCKIFLTEPLT